MLGSPQRLILIVALLGAALGAQSAAGGIAGVVLDPQHRAVAGATITLLDTNLNTSRQVASDASGRFAASQLAPGGYRLSVRADGLALARPLAITVGVGASVTVTLVLALRQAGQQVTVRAAAGEVEGQTVAPAVDQDSPKVANVVAGLTVTYLPSRDRDFTDFGTLAAGTVVTPAGVSVDGQRADDGAIEVDGAVFRDPLEGGVRGGKDGGFFLPQTAVQELSLVHAGADAQVGGTNGGFVDVATKGGSNRIHGEQFYIIRPSSWSGRDAFGHSVDNTQNEIGGSLGGAVIQNRLYFYGGAEQDFVHVPYWTAFQPQAPGVAVPATLAAQQGETVGRNNPTAVSLRLDYVVNRNTTLNVMGTYNRVRYSNVNPGSTQTWAAADNGDSLSGQSDWLHATVATSLGGAMQQLQAQWAGDRRDFMPNSTAPESDINGFGVLGGDALGPHRYISDQRGLSDDVAWSWRGQLLHVGGSFAYDPGQEFEQANLNGRLDYASLAAFLANSPRRSQRTNAAADGALLYRGTLEQGGAYVTDRAPLGDQLTLTAGLRWDGQWNPGAIPNDLGQWQPRLGLAWNPNLQTVVRVSGGLFDAPTPAALYQRVFTDNGVNDAVADSLLPGNVQVVVAPNFVNPRSLQSAASVQRRLGPRVDVTTGYTHNSTWNLPRALEANVLAPAPDATGMPIFLAGRPDPTLGQILRESSSAHSSYDAWLTTADLRLPYSTSLTANYTLARTRDDGAQAGPFQPPSALNPFDLTAEAGYANQDVRHSFNLSGTDRLPLGLKVNPVFVARSGMPYTPIIGFDTQGDGDDLNDRALVNGFVAARNSLRQPALYDLDLRFVKDFTLKGRGRHLDLFLDVFNVTGQGNRNFGPDGLGFYGDAAAPVFAAGQPLFAASTSELGGPRSIQFTARMVWF